MRRHFFTAVLILAALAVPISMLPADTSPAQPVAADGGDCDLEEYNVANGEYGAPHALLTTYEFSWERPENKKWDCDDLKEDLDYYQAAGSMRQSYQSFRSVYANSLQFTELVAWSEMEKATLYEYDNGTSLSAAKIAVQDSYGSYYTAKQLNLLSNWQAVTAASDVWENQSNYKMFDTYSSVENPQINPDETQNDWYDAAIQDSENGGDGYVTSYSVEYVGAGPDANITLANDTYKKVPTQQYKVSTTWKHTLREGETFVYNKTVNVAPDQDSYTYTLEWTTPDYAEDKVRIDAHLSGLQLVSPPTGNGQTYKGWFLNERYADALTKTTQEHDNYHNGSGQYVESIYNALNNDQITYNQAISRATQASDYLSNAATENASFSSIVVGLSSMGINSIDAINTSYMTVEFDAEQPGIEDNPITRDGMLLSRYQPDGGWSYNTTYYASNISGGQMFTDVNGEQYVINGTFKIISAHNSDGVRINSSDIHQPDRTKFHVENASSYAQWMQNQSDRINALEKQIESGTATGGGGIGFPDIPNPFSLLAAFSRWLVIAAIVFVAILLLAVAS